MTALSRPTSQFVRAPGVGGITSASADSPEKQLRAMRALVKDVARGLRDDLSRLKGNHGSDGLSRTQREQQVARLAKRLQGLLTWLKNHPLPAAST